MNKVLVVGSINMDLVVQAERFPGPGETLLGQSFHTFPGGKGANQAVAARRLGAQVAMLGCVGGDSFGRQLLALLETEGIDTRSVRTEDGVSTGVAAITVSQAENSIIVVPGANHALLPADVLVAESAFAATDVVLCQLEIPQETAEAAAAMAEKHGKPFILNPAPAVPLSQSLRERATLLTPNEHELAILLSVPDSAWQQQLARYPERILMTRGADGAWFAGRDGELHHQPAFAVSAVDTTGAGDTFNGALAAYWGKSFGELARLACAASALSVTRAGAQGGMPTQGELEEFLGSR
jgi:ribokinase